MLKFVNYILKIGRYKILEKVMWRGLLITIIPVIVWSLPDYVSAEIFGFLEFAEIALLTTLISYVIAVLMASSISTLTSESGSVCRSSVTCGRASYRLQNQGTQNGRGEPHILA